MDKTLKTLWDRTVPSGRISIKIEQNSLSKEGIAAVRGVLKKYWGEPEFDKYHWAWNWREDTGEFKGTLPTRIKNFLYKRYSFRASDEMLEEIGNLAKRDVGSSSGIYEIEFDSTLGWDSGKFGDSGSCFWQSRKDCLALLKHKESRAVLVYKDGVGLARTWMVRTPAGNLVLFNGYGVPLSDTARMVASILECNYKKIRFSCNGSSESVLYINGGSGYHIYSGEQPEISESFDLGWRRLIHCINCSDIMEASTTYGICNKCFIRTYRPCRSDGCSQMIPVLDYLSSGGRCERCRKNRCRNCGKICSGSLSSNTLNPLYTRTNLLCPSCYELFTSRKSETCQTST